MSDLRPKGVPVKIGGEEHNLLFTINAVDEIQDRMNLPIDEVFDSLTNPWEAWKALKTMLACLLNDEQGRKKFYGEIQETKVYTEEEVGWMVLETDKYVIIEAMLRAYGVSLPETEEESPNMESVQQPEKS